MPIVAPFPSTLDLNDELVPLCGSKFARATDNYFLTGGIPPTLDNKNQTTTQRVLNNLGGYDNSSQKTIIILAVIVVFVLVLSYTLYKKNE